MKILLAVDGSECSQRAVEEIARTPWPERSIVRVASVAEIRSLTLPTEWEEIFEGRSIANIAKAVSRFGEIAGARVEITTKTLRGDPKAVLLDEAEHWHADLIVVGTHGFNALTRLWLGSVSRAVVTHAKCSVRVARSLETKPRVGTRILIAVDGSVGSDAAINAVSGRPWVPGTEVHIVSAIQLPFVPTAEAWALPEGYYKQLEQESRDQAKAAIKGALAVLEGTGRKTPLTVTAETIVGHPEEVILGTAKARGSNLIILGSHGYRGIERFLLGSVSSAVAFHAHCSVEIVRVPLTGSDQ
ncbi:MAG: universal stress protein [Acidobacteriota bacterium]